VSARGDGAKMRGDGEASSRLFQPSDTRPSTSAVPDAAREREAALLLAPCAEDAVARGALWRTIDAAVLLKRGVERTYRALTRHAMVMKEKATSAICRTARR